jgi:hypothetical protein
MSITKEDLRNGLQLLEQKLVRFINSKTYNKPQNVDNVDLGYKILILQEEMANLQKIQIDQCAIILKLENQIKELEKKTVAGLF